VSPQHYISTSVNTTNHYTLHEIHCEL